METYQGLWWDDILVVFLQQMSFVGVSMLELMYASLIERVRLNHIHSHAFLLINQLPLPMEITTLICTTITDLLFLWPRHNRNYCIRALNLVMLISQRNLSSFRNLVAVNYGELQPIISTEGNLLFLLNLWSWVDIFCFW